MAYNTVPLEVSDRGHRDALVRMWTENLSDRGIGAVSDARLRWFYDENPVGPARTFLAVHVEEDQVIGCGSTFPRRMWVKGRLLRSAIPSDFAVVKKHRVGGAAIAIQRALTVGSRAAGYEFLFGFPNHMSLPIVKRVGYQVVADARAWVKPLRTAYKLEGVLKRPLLARAAGVVVDAALRAVDRVSVPPRRGAWSTEVLDRADRRFDALWERARGNYRIIGEKTAAFLDWRYAGFKTRRYQLFCLTEKPTGALAGFVVFTALAGKVYVVDLFAADAGDTVDHLLMAFARGMREAGHLSIYVSFVGRRSFGDRLETLGYFRSGDQERSLVVYTEKGAPADLAADLRDPENWFMFDGEMDI